jgi:GNAT superfamily N-acetyltransferase
MLESRPPYELSDDPARLDVALIHRFLSEESYWAKGIPFDTVQRAIANSLCLGIHHASDGQCAFARVVTDRATFAYACDVFVLRKHRGVGLSKWMMAALLAHPHLQGLRRIALATRDAHGLYRSFGFTPLARPENWLNIHAPDVYAPKP